MCSNYSLPTKPVLVFKSPPPQALHSEGHQDSMGLCLFLALNEKLAKKYINLMLLDDVVMSVDSTHRKSLCDLLSKFYPDRQFIITTHDKTWSSQLKHEGIVKSNNSVEFFDWKIDTGPLVNYETDIWKRISLDIKKNNISDAASKLRRASEEYFSLVCDSLKAFVQYKINHNHDLNDFLTGALSQYNKILKLAKQSANSWSNKELLEDLKLTESTSSQIFKRVGGEQWAINVNVHYNEWSNFIAQDFKQVSESFQDLFSVFKCNECAGLLKLISSGSVKESIKCNCGKVNWNLILKN